MNPSDLPTSHLRGAPTSDPLAALLPAVDASIGRASTGGNEALYRRPLRMFCSGQRDAVVQFRAARASGDAKAATRIAHNLRAVAGSLGMPALAQAGRALEAACLDAADDARLAPLVAEVEQRLTGVLGALDTISLG